jgi:hypothetical protein
MKLIQLNPYFMRRFFAVLAVLLLGLLFNNCSIKNGKVALSLVAEEEEVFNLSSSAKCQQQNNHLLKPQLRRLTQVQFRNSISSSFGITVAQNLLPEFNDINKLTGLTSDPSKLLVNSSNIVNVYDSADAIARQILTQNSNVASCVAASNDTCISNLISTYGLRLYRRPLTAAEQTDLVNISVQVGQNSAIRSEKIKAVLMTMLISPNHLYLTEIGDQAALQTAIFNLTDYEIASLLSFSLWDSPPDQTLLNLANTQQLKNLNTLKDQVNRMITDAKFNSKISSFMLDFLNLKDVLTAQKSSTYQLTTAERQNLLTSAEMTIADSLSVPNSGLVTPFRNESSFVNNSTARFFNLNSNSYSANLTKVNLANQQRKGILSHPAFLTSVSGVEGSGIVKRGVYTLEQLLCVHFGIIPANTTGRNDLPADFNPNLISERQVLNITHSSQSRCIGCHTTIDPAGSAFENFDAIGRYRTVEKNKIPIDSSGEITGLGTDVIRYSNSLQFMDELANSKVFKQCISKQFFKYVMGQDAEKGAGNCEHSNLAAKIDKISPQNEPSFKQLFESYVELESFTKRKPASK